MLITIKNIEQGKEGDNGKESAGMRSKKNKFSAGHCGSDVNRFSNS
jgi:hypothetical protein